jgi:hypothetical protein
MRHGFDISKSSREKSVSVYFCPWPPSLRLGMFLVDSRSQITNHRSWTCDGWTFPGRSFHRTRPTPLPRLGDGGVSFCQMEFPDWDRAFVITGTPRRAGTWKELVRENSTNSTESPAHEASFIVNVEFLFLIVLALWLVRTFGSGKSTETPLLFRRLVARVRLQAIR